MGGSGPDEQPASAFRWGDSVPHLLWRAQNAVHRVAQEAVDDLGVTVTQLGLAVHLAELGALSASDLSRGFAITPQSVATALVQLHREGWVVREPHPVHRRVILHRLTPRGEEQVAAGIRRMTEVDARIRGALADAETDDLVVALRDVLLAVDGQERPMEPLWPVRPG